VSVVSKINVETDCNGTKEGGDPESARRLRSSWKYVGKWKDPNERGDAASFSCMDRSSSTTAMINVG
jgi:hypothetical protein